VSPLKLLEGDSTTGVRRLAVSSAVIAGLIESRIQKVGRTIVRTSSTTNLQNVDQLIIRDHLPL
jgi:hypothetical protein